MEIMETCVISAVYSIGKIIFLVAGRVFQSHYVFVPSTKILFCLISNITNSMFQPFGFLSLNKKNIVVKNITLLPIVSGYEEKKKGIPEK